MFAMAFAVLFGQTAGAQEKAVPAVSGKLLFATGDVTNGSTYATMGNQLLKYCGRDFAATFSSGGVQNGEWLMGNKVSAAIVQPDMLEILRRNDPAKVANIRTLFTLHEEEVHLIATTATTKEGGNWLWGGTQKSINNFGDLNGLPIGAVGGSTNTANIISATADAKWKVMNVSGNKDLKQQLLDGKLAAAVVVGGAQHEMVASLPATFRLIAIPKDVQAKLVASKLYRPAKLTYPNLGAVGVDTVSVTATVVSRVYHSPEMLAKLKNLRECFQKNLPTIQDQTGTHEKWQMVDANYKGGWPWYDLP